MQILRHLCGQPLERQLLERSSNPPGTYYYPTPSGEHVIRMVRVEHCPRCNEPLDDADMVDQAGVPLAVDDLPARAVDRRAVLATLAGAGYTLHWENGAWFIRYGQRDQNVASAATLDAIIEQARVITTTPDRGSEEPAV